MSNHPRHRRLSASQHLAQYLVYVVVRWVVCIMQILSPRGCQALARSLRWLAFDTLGIRRKLTLENLRHAYPQWSEAQRVQLARQMWEHLVLLVCEIAHLPLKIHETNWRKHVTLVNEKALVLRLLDQRPVVLISAHFGNFELCGYLLGLFGYPTQSVARPLDNVYLHRFINEFRGRTGQRLIPTKEGFEDVIDVLNQGGALGLIADQYGGPKGCPVTFFDRPARAHKGIGLLVMQHQAPLAVGYAVRTGKMLQYKMVVQSVIDPADQPEELANLNVATQWYTSEIERFVRLSPDQYWWLHNRWKQRQPKRRGRLSRTTAQDEAPRAA